MLHILLLYEQRQKKSEQMYTVQYQLKYTKISFSHSQLNPVTEMTDQKGFLNKTLIPYITGLQKTQMR